TLVWRIDPQKFTLDELQMAASLFRQGRLVAFPTETVYGLGANALDGQAVQGIFQAKGRPVDNPLIVHIAALAEIWSLVEAFPPLARSLAETFWPGPLTLVLPASGQVPAVVTAGLPTVGIRLPDHPVARALIRLAGVPVAAPSANRSGKPSPTTARHVLEDLNGRIAGVVDGGACAVGVESTVVDVTGSKPVILRPGGVTREMLTRVAGPVTVDRAVLDGDAVPRSPGMKYTHYAPRAPVFLLPGVWENQCKVLAGLLPGIPDLVSGPLGLLISRETQAELGPGLETGLGTGGPPVIRLTGSRGDLSLVAARLFGLLREFDSTDVKLILAETYPQEGIGLALMNRLAKAAGGHTWPPGRGVFFGE
ncbi:MAG: L-threonylcarbamoyladenylate synthase, partial [Heliobacteriaceae bacterium]|nr:L-threonylcarbamoyladenylate synthase [Heliobacteriaceae bacterium]